MAQDKRKLLDVLKFELDFLEKGGYRERPHASWRSHFFFEDSPTCLNLSLAPSERACPECILIQLVPADRQLERFPCQHIRLNERSETLDSLSCSTQQEIEAVVASWLRTVIQGLERADVANASRALNEGKAQSALADP